jgi:hypothetical protein
MGQFGFAPLPQALYARHGIAYLRARQTSKRAWCAEAATPLYTVRNIDSGPSPYR